jgi:hypothetical protein
VSFALTDQSGRVPVIRVRRRQNTSIERFSGISNRCRTDGPATARPSIIDFSTAATGSWSVELASTALHRSAWKKSSPVISRRRRARRDYQTPRVARIEMHFRPRYPGIRRAGEPVFLQSRQHRMGGTEFFGKTDKWGLTILIPLSRRKSSDVATRSAPDRRVRYRPGQRDDR